MEGLLELVYPPACVACDEVLPGTGFFCDECAHLVLETQSPHCRRCSEPGAFPAGICPRCEGRRPPFMKAYAPFEHDGSVAKAIHRFKYEQRPDLSRPLASLLASAAAAFFKEVTAPLVPMPLHTGRFRERGYDQATLLAVELGAVLKRPVRDEWLSRTRETTRQVGLSEDARDANVRGAFSATAAVKGSDVLLVDDVYTTGSTASEAARTLVAAGAGRVFVVTLARARRELM
ncbi:MAG: ComF family protein [Archangiaceae bacterium]|nr:ComF family protein [Archangiaceae bacterium]